MNPLVRLAVSASYPLRRPFLRRRVRRLVLERAEGFDLVVLPDVLNPVVFRTGVVLARLLAERFTLAPPQAGARALDMGTGSGIGSLALARAGFSVTAVDVNPEAVRCARLNAVLNRLEDRIAPRCGDLFAPVASERFDLVVFNPPFFVGAPRDLHDLSWRSEGTWERFTAGLRDALSPAGAALCLLSDHGDEAGMRRTLEAAGLGVGVAARVDLANEVLTLYEARA